MKDSTSARDGEKACLAMKCFAFIQILYNTNTLWPRIRNDHTAYKQSSAIKRG
jgi:hypothetical protein